MLSGYVEQSPKDEEALRELAGLYLARANALAQDAQIAQLRASYRTFGSTFSVPLDLGEGATLGAGSDRRGDLHPRLAGGQRRVRQGADRVPERGVHRTTSWRRLPHAIRTSSSELAQAAQQSGNVAKAITAYERFIVLAPDDPSASIVKQQIEQLKAAQQPPASG